MSYQVIARKYRPQRFADVVGQEHVTQTLANAIAQNRIAHAYLFCGPRGTGKTTIARIFAKCLNCTGGPSIDFPDDDPRCREITEGRSIDVLEIDGASNNGVEQVRELRDTCRYAPATSKFKIYIIDEVHMLTTAAFNALLKTLEEPPAHVKFMFATTDPEKVLPTILSRCQRFDLRRIPNALIVQHLAQIARQERVTLEENALHAIARGADGGMRDAESTLDQLISFCGDRIVESDVLSMFGLTAQAQILDLGHAILVGDAANTLALLDGLARSGKDLGRLLADLLEHFRNLLIFQVSKGDLRLIQASEGEINALKAEAGLAPPDAVGRILEVLSESEWRLREVTSRRIALEVALLKAIQSRDAVPLDAVLKQLNDWRNQSPATSPNPSTPSPRAAVAVAVPAPARIAPAPAAPSNTPAPPPPPSPSPSPSPGVEPPRPVATPRTEAAGGSIDLDALWRELVEAVGRVSRFTRGYLLEAHPVSFVKRVLTIGFAPEFAEHIGLVDNSKNHTLLQTKLAEMGHPGCQFKFIKSERPEGHVPLPAEPAAPAASPLPASTAPATPGAPTSLATPRPLAATPGTLSKEDFKNDPLIQKALEIFKGQITEVRA
jgi:DNA polymerase-3 subunit gamma/tau